MRYELICDSDNYDNIVLRCDGKIVEEIKTNKDFVEWLQASKVMFELVYEDRYVEFHRGIKY